MNPLKRLWDWLTIRRVEPSISSWQQARLDMRELKPRRRYGEPTRWVRTG